MKVGKNKKRLQKQIALVHAKKKRRRNKYLEGE
jgi:hypothetical protein